MCCGWTSRGVGLGDGKVFVGQLDGKLVALDQTHGQGRLVDASRALAGRLHDHGAPLYYDGLVITGFAGGEFGDPRPRQSVRREDGKLVWTFYTIPGPGELGHDTWPQDNDAWKHGGAPVWQTPAVDPELGLIYFSTGNPGPDFNGAVRARRQPVHRVDRRARREDRQVPLALPGGASRHLGLRRARARSCCSISSIDGAHAQGHRAGRQDGLGLHPRPHERQAADRHRREARCRRSRARRPPRRSRIRAATRSCRTSIDIAPEGFDARERRHRSSRRSGRTSRAREARRSAAARTGRRAPTTRDAATSTSAPATASARSAPRRSPIDAAGRQALRRRHLRRASAAAARHLRGARPAHEQARRGSSSGPSSATAARSSTAGGLVFVGRNDGRLTALDTRDRHAALGVPDRRRHERARERVRARRQAVRRRVLGRQPVRGHRARRQRLAVRARTARCRPAQRRRAARCCSRATPRARPIPTRARRSYDTRVHVLSRRARRRRPRRRQAARDARSAEFVIQTVQRRPQGHAVVRRGALTPGADPRRRGVRRDASCRIERAGQLWRSSRYVLGVRERAQRCGADARGAARSRAASRRVTRDSSRRRRRLADERRQLVQPSATRRSPQINRSNVAQAQRRLAHAPERLGRRRRSTPAKRSRSSSTASSTSSTGANDVFAIDVDTGAILWQLPARTSTREQRPCAAAGRTAASRIGDGKVFVGQLDGKLVALDAKTGKVAWSIAGRALAGRLHDHERAAVLRRPRDHGLRRRRVRRARPREGVRREGRQARCGRSTRSRAAASPATRPGRRTTRSGSTAAARCGRRRPSIPSSACIYFSTGNPGPDFNGAVRAGDNLFTSSIVARRSEDRQIPLALPAGAPRPLGLRQRRTPSCCSISTIDGTPAQGRSRRRARRAGSTSSTARTASRSSASTSGRCRRSRARRRPPRSRTRAATRSCRSRSTSRPRATRS